MKNHPTETWQTGTFAHDTLIYALGALALSILEKAAADRQFLTRYEAWLSVAAQDATRTPSVECMLTTGAGEGSASLFARERDGEFCVHCEHPAFDALIAVGFDLARLECQGVLVAQFEGDACAALAFANALTRRVKQLPPELTDQVLHFMKN